MSCVLLTNDDGVGADGLLAMHQALLERGLRVLVVAPSVNRSGVSRSATYGEPVTLTRVAGEDGVFECSGTPVDCVRASLLSGFAPDISMVLSGINHGANLGDDTLNSGTVGAAAEGALLGLPAIAVSQQSHKGFFHILDALDQTTPVYHETAEIAALIVELALEWESWPERALLNLNVPAEVNESSTEIRVSRLGRRFYQPGSADLEEHGFGHSVRTYGLRTDPAPPHEEGDDTDFGALAAGDVSVSLLSYAWDRDDQQDLSWLRDRVLGLSNAFSHKRTHPAEETTDAEI